MDALPDPPSAGMTAPRSGWDAAGLGVICREVIPILCPLRGLTHGQKFII